MSQPWQFVELPVGGVDLRTDPMKVAPPKVQVADNMSVDIPGRARKRQGTKRRADRIIDSGGLAADLVPTSDVAVRDVRWVTAERSGRVLGCADGLLLSENGGSWTVRGFLDQIRISAGAQQQDVFAGDVHGVDVGVAGDVLAMGWVAQSTVYLGLYDLSSGALIHPLLTPALFGGVKLATIPELGLVLAFGGGGGGIQALPILGDTVRTTSTALLFGGAVDVVTDAASLVFDVLVVGQRVLLVYMNNANQIARCWVAPSGQRDSAIATEAPGAVVTAVAVGGVDTNRRALIAWASDAGNFIKARDYNTDATITPNAAVATIDALTGYKQIGIAVDGTAWTILYETGTGAALENRVLNRSTWDTASVPHIRDALRHSSLASKLWRDPGSGRWYFVSVLETKKQPSPQVTYFVHALGVPQDVITSASNPSILGALPAFPLVGILWPGLAGGVLESAGLPSVPVIGRVARMGLLYRFDQTDEAALLAARTVTIEHAPDDMQTAVEGPDATYVPGGILWRIDERLNIGHGGPFSVCETGFALSPEGALAAPAAGGAITPSSAYTCRYFYRDLGTGERSSSFGTSLNTGAAQGTINHTVPTLTHTNRTAVVIDVYRSQANPVLGAPLFYVGSIDNRTDVDTVTFVDTLVESTLITRRRDYLSFGEVDEDAPPANTIFAIGQGRAVSAGQVDDDATVWITKPRQSLEPLRWSQLLLVVADHPTPGRITALAWNGPDLVAWRADSIQILSGQGPDPTGVGGTLQPARIVSDHVGCRTPRSLVRLPSGWLFQAADGTYWLLGLDGNLVYVGVDVEPLNAPCLGAFVVHRDKQVKFVTAEYTLVFHYDTGVWTTSTLKALSAAALADGTGLYLPSSTAMVLLEDDPDGWRDDGLEYRQTLRMPAFRPAGVQGEIEVRRVLFAGGTEGPHRPLVHVYYDYEGGHQESYVWDAEEVVGTITQGDGTQVFGGPSRLNLATQVYQFAVPLARARCMAVTIEVYDRPVGGDEPLDGSFWITAVGYEWRPADPQGSSAYRLEERRLAT